MRTLTILLFIISSTLQAQINLATFEFKEDKINHFSCGYLIGFTGNFIGYEVTKNKTAGLISGIVLSSLSGYLKEKYDKNNGRNFSKPDMLATIYGGAAGSITVRLILGNSTHRKKCRFILEN